MKPGGQYRKGVKWERWLVKRLALRGAEVAFRSAGSHSPIDVVGEFLDYRYLAQCKAGTRPPQKEYDKLRLLSLGLRYCIVALWWFPDREPVRVTEWENGKQIIRRTT